MHKNFEQQLLTKDVNKSCDVRCSRIRLGDTSQNPLMFEKQRGGTPRVLVIVFFVVVIVVLSLMMLVLVSQTIVRSTPSPRPKSGV